MNEKRIICTVTNDLTYDRRMIRICSSLAKNGFEVLLVGKKLKSSLPLCKQPFQQRRLKCFFTKGKAFYLEYNLRLLLFLLFQKKAILYAVDLDTILPNFWISKWKKMPCVYDAHEYFSEVPEVVHRPKVKRVWEAVADYTIPKLTYCYTVGEALANEFQLRYGTPFSVIRNVPPFVEKVETSYLIAEKKILLYQGALNEGRGIEALLHTMQRIENAVLWLVGEGDLSLELREMAIALKVQDKVKFWGYIPPEQLAAITQQAYIGLNLLENRGLSYYFSLANKAFDYIQSEKPSIHACFPEYQTLNASYEVALLIEDLHPDTLQKAIQQLLQDTTLYKRLKENCGKAKLEYNWEKEEERLLDFWANVK